MFNVSKDTKIELKSEGFDFGKLILEESTTTNGRKWTVRTKDEKPIEGALSTQTLAEGETLKLLFEDVANGNEVSKEFAELANIQEFRVFSRCIPKMETVEHRERVQKSIKEKFKRAKEHLKVIAEGASWLAKTKRPSRIMDKDYVLPEIATYKNMPIEAARKFAHLWKESDTTLDYKSWLAENEENWKKSQSKLELLPWLSACEWDKKEKKAWKADFPNESFSSEKFVEWKKTQFKPDSLLPEPEWLLKKMCLDWNVQRKSKNSTEVPYEKWLEIEISGRMQYWKNVPMESEGLVIFDKLDDATFKRLDRKFFEYDNMAGSSLPALGYVAKELWKETNPSDTSEEAFIQYIEMQKCVFSRQTPVKSKLESCERELDRLETRPKVLLKKLEEQKNACHGKAGRAKAASLSIQIDSLKQHIQELGPKIAKLKLEKETLEKELKVASSPSKSDFEDWKMKRDDDIKKRWQLTRTSLPLDNWKSHQVSNPLVPMPFVSLNKEERKTYETKCVDGILQRNNEPFSTLEEMTAHSGKGWVIFVIGPNGNLYSGSHLPGVFHHSSFLANSAIMAAGELKTDKNGKITHISSKSGHYKPVDKNDISMLRWFEGRGTNLKEISFNCFVSDGIGMSPSETMIALDYLNGQKPLPKKR